jgi:hypothetical protein
VRIFIHALRLASGGAPPWAEGVPMRGSSSTR